MTVSRSPERVGQQDLRRQNLSVVLRHLWQHGSRSRADIAAETGLNKGTVSSLVEELNGRGLVRELELAPSGRVGRPPRMLEVDGSSVGALGLQVNVESIVSYGVDLAGRVLLDDRAWEDMPALSVVDAVERLAAVTRSSLEEMVRRGARPGGLSVAVPGLVDVTRGVVVFAPNLGWRNVPLADLLADALGPDVPVRIDNDANLAALAEFRQGSVAGTPDLLYLTGEVGVGGGVIAGGRLLRGADGFSGEVGHLPVDPAGERCGCGRIGCWETKVGLGALLRASPADDGEGAPSARESSLERCALVLARARTGDVHTLAALADIGHWLGVGAGTLINLFNPRVLVLGGHFAELADFLVPPAARTLDQLVVAGSAARYTIVPSVLGFSAGVLGGTGVVLQQVLDDPTRIPVRKLAVVDLDRPRQPTAV